MLAIIRKDVQHHVQTCVDFDGQVQAIALHIYKNDLKILLILVYRSPYSDSQAFTNLTEFMRDLCSGWDSHIVIAGDFNLPLIDWDNTCVKKVEQLTAPEFYLSLSETLTCVKLLRSLLMG